MRRRLYVEKGMIVTAATNEGTTRVNPTGLSGRIAENRRRIDIELAGSPDQRPAGLPCAVRSVRPARAALGKMRKRPIS